MSDGSQSSDSSRDNQDSNTSNSNNGRFPGDFSLNRTNYNSFANDGSFMDLFKKTMEKAKQVQADKNESRNDTTVDEAQDATTTSGKIDEEKKTKDEKKTPILSFVGKRRGGKILKTGMVKKPKTDDEQDEKPKDAWAKYMAEVKKYKQQACEEEGKTRPLVK